MTLGSLLAAGAAPDGVSAALRRLGVPFELTTEKVEINGVGALRVTIRHPEEHAHRDFRAIRAMVEGADLPDRAAGRAVEAFHRLAAAEGAVHGVDPEEVTFHEVGAVDSIVDVVGSCVALEFLDVSTVTCGPLPMGTGVVRAAHGHLPVPGPATLEVLKGSRIRWTEEPRETTTPTGACGAGSARLEHAPNLLRAVVGEVEGPTGELTLLEANVDDATGEIFGAAVDKLLAEGAPDAWLEPIVMKRGRGAYKVCALVEERDRERLAHRLMRETGALGVRHRNVGRTVAERRRVRVELPYGRCRVKVGSLDGEDFVAAPEYADAARLAEKTGMPLARVFSDARAAYEHGKTVKTEG